MVLNIINISVMSTFGCLSTYGKGNPRWRNIPTKENSRNIFKMKKLCAKTVKVITGRA